MSTLFLLVLALLPGFLLLYFILFMDRNEKEPLGLVVTIMALGAFSVVPAAIIEHLMDSLPVYGASPFLDALIVSFGQAALVEETAKLAVVLLFAYKSKHFNEENDGIVYVGASALGFAMLENVFYVLSKGMGTGLLRSITAVPLHCFTGVLMGFYVGKSKFSPSKKERNKKIFKGFFLAFMLHGIYDTLIFTRTPAALLIFPLVIGLVIFGIRVIKKSRALSAVRAAALETGADPVVQQQLFIQASPKHQLWKIILSRTLLVASGLFWGLLIFGFLANLEQFKSRVFDLILGGILLSALPILTGVLLEISYRRRRALYNEKKDIFKDVPETVLKEELTPPGFFWQVVVSRTLLTLGGLFWTFLILGILAEPGGGFSQVLELLLGGTVISFVPIYVGMALEISFRKKKKIYNQLLKTDPGREVAPGDLRLSPPGQLWRVILARIFLILGGLFWLLFLFEFFLKGVKVVSDLSGNVLAGTFLGVLLLTAPLIVAGVLLEISYRGKKAAYKREQEEKGLLPPSHDPKVPLETDEDFREYSQKLKSEREQDRFYYKKRE